LAWWAWTLVATAALYALLVAALAIAGRREHAGAIARFVPDCVVLLRRLLRDPRLPRRQRRLLLALLAYLALPFDLVPDFIPVAGQLDDAILVLLVLRSVVRAAGPEVVRQHWAGPQQTLTLVLRAAGTRS
jgi:uncharacterized membrane protein YkvA (DUF1232 family)